MSQRNVLKFGAVAAAMVLFAANSFAGVVTSQDAVLKVGDKKATYLLDGLNKGEANMAGTGFGEGKGKFAFVYNYSGLTGTSSFDILWGSDILTNANGTYKSGGTSIYSPAGVISIVNPDMAKKGFRDIKLTVQDKQRSPAIDLDLFDIALNGTELTTGIGDKHDQFPGAVYPGVTYGLYHGAALESIKLTGLFKVKNGAFDGTGHSTGKNGDYDKTKDYSLFDLSFTNAGKFGASADTSVIPEPTTLALLPLALGGAFFASRRRKAAAK
ncbi:PEP-CTERM sorting domain-containing protein [Roseateles oligotrophus]|uniref:PEP-CTERM sorting domain-containing protein n=1 Tax=Roseateles oligotrophus TaxID=1769250 RepID=A0ABT2Y9W7_9BURK|nr:PEP-CTERM sorting domain-containing protein [Roseateles oligotrophus]MCV2367105.1 PEP-CTERM sorting domain-containing protein [Roseateles oligotrophus]